MDGDFYILRVPASKWVTSRGDVAQYLPTNYSILCKSQEGDYYVYGMDDHGWSAEGYIIPRLGSAMIYAEVVIMKREKQGVPSHS